MHGIKNEKYKSNICLNKTHILSIKFPLIPLQRITCKSKHARKHICKHILQHLVSN